MNTPKPEPKTRGYDPLKHSALPYIDKEYKAVLDLIAEHTGRNKKKSVEKAIYDAALACKDEKLSMAVAKALSGYTAQVNK